MKFRKFSIAALLCATTCAALAQAPAPAPSPAPAATPAAGCVKQKLSAEPLDGNSPDNPAAKEVGVKHVPGLKHADQVDTVRLADRSGICDGVTDILPRPGVRREPAEPLPVLERQH